MDLFTWTSGRHGQGVISTTKRTRLAPPVNDVKHMRFRPRARRPYIRGRTYVSSSVIIIIHYITRGPVSTDARVHSSSSTPGA